MPTTPAIEEWCMRINLDNGEDIRWNLDSRATGNRVIEELTKAPGPLINLQFPNGNTCIPLSRIRGVYLTQGKWTDL